MRTGGTVQRFEDSSEVLDQQTALVAAARAAQDLREEHVVVGGGGAVRGPATAAVLQPDATLARFAGELDGPRVLAAVGDAARAFPAAVLADVDAYGVGPLAAAFLRESEHMSKCFSNV